MMMRLMNWRTVEWTDWRLAGWWTTWQLVGRMDWQSNRQAVSPFVTQMDWQLDNGQLMVTQTDIGSVEWTDCRTNRLTVGWMDWWTDKLLVSWMNRLIDRWTNSWMNQLTVGWMDWWSYKHTNGWTNAPMEWMDGQMDCHLNTETVRRLMARWMNWWSDGQTKNWRSDHMDKLTVGWMDGKQWVISALAHVICSVQQQQVNWSTM